jgi:molybdate transport system substrate-binding protein
MKSRQFRKWSLIALFVAALTSGFATASTAAEPLRIFAAASLKTALDEIAQNFSELHDTEVSVSYAGSSALARQIGLGAPADVFISANEAWMDALEDQGHVRVDSRRDLLGNRLVVIAAKGAAPLSRLNALPEKLADGHLAMAQINAVPAGLYGKAALEKAGVWPALTGHVAQTDNVRAALALVATGATPYGIVYLTDATADARVSVVFNIPEDLHPPIVYPAAAVSDNGLSPVFLDHLQSTPAQSLFRSQGFIPMGAP